MKMGVHVSILTEWPSMVLSTPVRNEFGGSLCLLSASCPLLCFKFVKSGTIDIVHELLLYSLFLFHFPFLFWRRGTVVLVF